MTSKPNVILVSKHSGQLKNKVIFIPKFDLCTLYTNNPHQKLKSVMGELINVSFNSGNQEFSFLATHLQNVQLIFY